MKIIQNTPLTISEEEEAAQLAESRKATAESDFVILLEDKKRVFEEIEDGKKLIENNNAVLEDTYKKINETNTALVEFESKYRKEKQQFDVFKTESEEKISIIEKQIQQKQIEKDEIVSEISTLIKKYGVLKIENSKEIIELQENKNTLTDSIKKLESESKSMISDLGVKKESIILLETQIEELKTTKSSLENVVVTHTHTVEDLLSEIKNKKTEIEQLDSTLVNKKKEDAELDSSIIKKTEEYDILVKDAFAILARKETLDQKEEYIRSRYEQAGIKWPE